MSKAVYLSDLVAKLQQILKAHPNLDPKVAVRVDKIYQRPIADSVELVDGQLVLQLVDDNDWIDNVIASLASIEPIDISKIDDSRFGVIKEVQVSKTLPLESIGYDWRKAAARARAEQAALQAVEQPTNPVTIPNEEYTRPGIEFSLDMLVDSFKWRPFPATYLVVATDLFGVVRQIFDGAVDKSDYVEVPLQLACLGLQIFVGPPDWPSGHWLIGRGKPSDEYRPVTSSRLNGVTNYFIQPPPDGWAGFANRPSKQ